MTYSEVREMYSLYAERAVERREKNRRNLKEALRLTLCYLLPWMLSVATLLVKWDYPRIHVGVISAMLLFSSFALYRSSEKAEPFLKAVYISFSYLVTLSILLTYTLV